MNTLPEWVTDPQAATPPLDEYLAAEEEEPNLFWMIGCGHHENLLDAAVTQRDEARVEVERLSTIIRMTRDLLNTLNVISDPDLGVKCSSCGADISEYAEGLTLCAICDPEVDDK